MPPPPPEQRKGEAEHREGEGAVLGRPEAVEVDLEPRVEHQQQLSNGCSLTEFHIIA